MADLFDPIQVGTFEVKNRVVFAATGTGYAHHDGSVMGSSARSGKNPDLYRQ